MRQNILFSLILIYHELGSACLATCGVYSYKLTEHIVMFSFIV